MLNFLLDILFRYHVTHMIVNNVEMGGTTRFCDFCLGKNEHCRSLKIYIEVEWQTATLLLFTNIELSS